mgnify:CR=1 FL=1
MENISFNPRAREGRDSQEGSDREVLPGFNPRAREGRDRYKLQGFYNLLFQSTRPRGARHLHRTKRMNLQGFNPRAREGRDPDGYGFMRI